MVMTIGLLQNVSQFHAKGIKMCFSVTQLGVLWCCIMIKYITRIDAATCGAMLRIVFTRTVLHIDEFQKNQTRFSYNMSFDSLYVF